RKFQSPANCYLNKKYRMLNSMAFLKYSKAERWIAFLLLPPVAVVLNISMFGQRSFQSFWDFLLATVVTLAVVFLIYITCGMAGVLFLNKYPQYSQTFRRIAFSLLAYLLILVAGISPLYFGYDYLG